MGNNKKRNSSPKSCTRCKDLVKSRNCIVNGRGSGESGVFLIGEAPGKKEDEKGKPFVGKSGKFLSRKLRNLNINPEEVRITNTIRCRPSNNRNPYKKEIKNCKEYLKNEISKFNPEVICTLGLISTSNILDKKIKMKNVVGNIKKTKIRQLHYTVVPCYHPASVFYDRSKEKKIEETLKKVKKITHNCD